MPKLNICESRQFGRIVLPGVAQQNAVLGIVSVVAICVDIVDETVGDQDLRDLAALVEEALAQWRVDLATGLPVSSLPGLDDALG